MRILAIDIGEKRVGVAISDELGIIAVPLETIERKDDEQLISALKKTAVDNCAARLIVGLPLNLDGTVGDSASKVLSFVERLKKEAALEVLTWDERLTTREAQRRLIELDRSRKRRRKVSDEAAAVLILQAYLDWRKQSGK